MQVSVDFQDESLALELPGEALVGRWDGPPGIESADAAAALRRVLEHPVDFPPVGQMVVPGDRVAIALDSTLGRVDTVLHVLAELLRASGVNHRDVTVVATPNGRVTLPADLPQGMTLHTHNPAESGGMAYLATTREGRRIYLNRYLTDADVVIPVGRLGYDPILGYRGPWSLLFPGLGDQESAASYRHRLTDDPPGRIAPRIRLEEPFEVSWLLGTQFHLGLLPGVSGLVEAVAGLAEPVRDRGIQSVDENWLFQPPARAECVVAGIGASGMDAGIAELVEGLVTASRLVTHGGRIVALSRASGSIGPSLSRLVDSGDARDAAAALRGHEADPDSVAGRRLAQVLAWADVYLLSGLDRQLVEDLSMVHVDHLDDARRLVSRSHSCLLVSRADLTRAAVCER
jgi:nickel-dependent lactate racemase